MNGSPSAAARRAQALEDLDYYEQEHRFDAAGLSSFVDPHDLERSTFECKECGDSLQATAFAITPNGHISFTCRSCRVKKKVKTQRANKKRIERIVSNQMEVTGRAKKTPEEILSLVIELRHQGWDSTLLIDVASHMEFLEQRYSAQEDGDE